jgi:hypothetical protein
MSDPHRLRSQSLVISSDKTLAARAALRIWVELMKRKRGPSWATHLMEGQQATVLQLPASAGAKTEQRAEPGNEQLSLNEASAILT